MAGHRRAGEPVEPAPAGLRSLLAANRSPLTLDGTRTYLVGRDPVAVIDPGPTLPEHLAAIAGEVAGATVVHILVTHDHPDHAAGAAALSRRLAAPVRGAAAGTLADGDVLETDAGELRAVATPGHSPDHVALHWPAAGAVFCGDLMLGGMDTALVAAPEGDLAAYMSSLERVRGLDPVVIYPTHGPPFRDPAGAIAAYMAHREARQRQVLDALARGPATPAGIARRVYGTRLEPGLMRWVEATTAAYLAFLADRGAARRADDGCWSLAE